MYITHTQAARTIYLFDLRVFTLLLRCAPAKYHTLRVIDWPVAEERNNYWLDRKPIRLLLSDCSDQREDVRGWH